VAIVWAPYGVVYNMTGLVPDMLQIVTMRQKSVNNARKRKPPAPEEDGAGGEKRSGLWS